MNHDDLAVYDRGIVDNQKPLPAREVLFGNENFTEDAVQWLTANAAIARLAERMRMERSMRHDEDEHGGRTEEDIASELSG